MNIWYVWKAHNGKGKKWRWFWCSLELKFPHTCVDILTPFFSLILDDSWVAQLRYLDIYVKWKHDLMKSVSCHCCWFWLDWFVVEGLAVFFFVALPWLCFYVSSGNETKIVSEISYLRFPPSITHSSFAACAVCVCVYLFSSRMVFLRDCQKRAWNVVWFQIYRLSSLTRSLFCFIAFSILSLCCCCSFSSFGTHKNFAKQTRNDLKGRKKAAAASKSKKKSIERVSEKLIWPAKNNRQQEEWERNQRSETSFNQKNIYIYLCVKPKTSPEANQLMMTKKEKNISFSFSSRFYFFLYFLTWFCFLLLYR